MIVVFAVIFCLNTDHVVSIIGNHLKSNLYETLDNENVFSGSEILIIARNNMTNAYKAIVIINNKPTTGSTNTRKMFFYPKL